ncbi:HAD family hydrolase [Terrimonas alba]|uniref:HAD family hydrolase n=1 Tax=Terrimonas alba TaxID=3349636 RepID=UPI0035F437C2
MFKAILFDLNGTMINDMEYHIKAWYNLLNELGAGLSMEETKLQCYGKNQELLERIFPGRFSEKEMETMSMEKERKYQQTFRPHLKLIAGLDEFLQENKDTGIKMGIGTAAIRFNVDFVLDGLRLHHYFDSIVTADDVINSKPDPETFLKGAVQLGVLPEECLVFEDSPKGAEAALHAGMKCVAITTMHEPGDFNTANIIKFISSYEKGLNGMLN